MTVKITAFKTVACVYVCFGFFFIIQALIYQVLMSLVQSLYSVTAG